MHPRLQADILSTSLAKAAGYFTRTRTIQQSGVYEFLTDSRRRASDQGSCASFIHSKSLAANLENVLQIAFHDSAQNMTVVRNGLQTISNLEGESSDADHPFGPLRTFATTVLCRKMVASATTFFHNFLQDGAVEEVAKTFDGRLSRWETCRHCVQCAARTRPCSCWASCR